MQTETKSPTTAAEIRRLVGVVDDAVISGIERTEASTAEVLQVVRWFRGGGGLEDEPGHEPHGAVRVVHEIPQAEEVPEL